ncbi:ADP compounds hydrolase NudE [Xenorhabdus nematophila]|uniref:Nudix hydrolase, active on adenosine(5')triphospho(5')adenosine, adenosine(5')diphospho(5')adenosine, ADP-ribose and NADH n=1 Tax=Xenorhabdus nematophila (strain ATCC 19061 / DSM 3370 / CCUG 14189 / LMG 1036 / NCIMB 9965 / AN6) TaxID=406817 RepID=D3VFU8_XENNA|nr:ADP compounds hydrolase NudE [Xenorhabdus nematophila]CEE92011.1 Nudix hydrolase, active on adenosine(5')triphospho(5')adenosine, adenosine(5')diphospho(5')adenosine, ADP-ribose and NADH [Xenorhabdus nematophila str. Anatoliense]CEF32139.1 Nudix hydrolase, active on adenosine(5')triphospho(5')adenosine, adenosine(5')diphospho(5')adenosine, ADP-ribose and NADH [Xenorhabdus nematophila str. Websteri]AYA41720.1 ADP compounds hydrolase NudE [Xenorhabdus nematophila]KHD29074.1 adenosine nucleotid
MIDLKKPNILNINDIAQSRLFNIQSVNLEFSNGVKRVYERMKPTNREAVLIIPVIGDELVLIHEYAVGIEQYELGFPKGAIDAGESVLEAANRELKEEIGFGARKLELLTKLTMAPSYFSSKMNIVIAYDLYQERLEGDEPEPLVQKRWPVSDMMSLLEQPDFNEARNVSALFFAQRYLQAQNNGKS